MFNIPPHSFPFNPLPLPPLPLPGLAREKAVLKEYLRYQQDGFVLTILFCSVGGKLAENLEHQRKWSDVKKGLQRWGCVGLWIQPLCPNSRGYPKDL